MHETTTDFTSGRIKADGILELIKCLIDANLLHRVITFVIEIPFLDDQLVSQNQSQKPISAVKSMERKR